MAAFALGAAAGGITDELQEILKQKFLEQIQQAQLAQRIREADMSHQIAQGQLGLGRDRLGLDRDKFGEDTRQFDVTSGQTQQRIDMEQEFQPVRIKHVTAQTADIERRPEAEEAGRRHDFELAGLTGGQRLQQIQAQTEGALRQIGAQNAGALRLLGARQTAAPTAQAQVTNTYNDERSRRILQSVEELERKVGPWTTGAGSLLANIPATDARNFAAELDSLKANIAFGELAEMRAASKTGGALGAVSERELALLESALGALDPGQSPTNFAAQLRKIRESLDRWSTAKAGAGSGGATPATAPTAAPMEFDFVPGRGLVPRGR